MSGFENIPVEALILAGGKGTRLHGILEDIPKPMAPVNGKPFLEYLMSNLYEKGIRHFVLSVGFRHESIIEYFGDKYKNAAISYVIENEALGTGGAIKYASQYIKNEKFWILNGDTFVDLNLGEFYFENNDLELSIGLVKMENFDRFGVVETKGRFVREFKEKKFTAVGRINAGIYLITKSFIHNHFPPERVFSFETDVLEKKINSCEIGHYTDETQFIDIGIPEDYFRSQFIFTNISDVQSIFNLDRSWTIFLDRDGVINERIPDSYIQKKQDFIFLPGAKEAIKRFAETFCRIIIVTNQQGIGKGLISYNQVEEINNYMISEITEAGGRIDGVYVCPDLAINQPNCRKPEPEMAIRAKKDFPEIDFNKSIMIGDSISDMLFGKNLGMKTILVSTKNEEKLKNCPVCVDWRVEGLEDLV